MAGMTGVFYLLARYPIRDLLNLNRPLRIFFLFGFLTVCLFGGSRSYLLLILAVTGILFYLEGLLRGKNLPLVVVGVALAGALIFPLADRLPYQIQRALSVLPVKVDPKVAHDAQASTDWRVQMWKRVLPDVPRYLILGKGCALDLREFDFLRQFRFRQDSTGLSAEMVGDYHNGPLSVIIPFGLPGVIALIWFWVAGWRWLVQQYRYGAPELRTVNTLLLALFVARIFHFLVVFGGFYYELVHFTGLVGLSVALNGQASSVPVRAEAAPPVAPRTRSLPAPLSPPSPAQS